MKKTMTNEELGNAIEAMATATDEKGMLGYAIARNFRKMYEEAKEYLEAKEEALKKYGKPIGQGYALNENEDPEGFKAYKKELGKIPDIQQEIDVVMVTPEEFYSGNLTSRQMSSLLWMVEEN